MYSLFQSPVLNFDSLGAVHYQACALKQSSTAPALTALLLFGHKSFNKKGALGAAAIGAQDRQSTSS